MYPVPPLPSPLYHSISHFRCEVANLTDGCDNLTMIEDVPNTAINTDEGVTECSSSYLMADPNWLDLQTFQPNVACAYYLPPLKGCCWELWLMKYLDPIVCGDNCQCDCEDNVCFEEVGNQFPNEKTYCDLDGGTPTAGWCGTAVGPHNVLGTLPFFSGKSSSISHSKICQMVRLSSLNIAGTYIILYI